MMTNKLTREELEEYAELIESLESGYWVQMSALDEIAMAVAFLLRREIER